MLADALGARRLQDTLRTPPAEPAGPQARVLLLRDIMGEAILPDRLPARVLLPIPSMAEAILRSPIPDLSAGSLEEATLPSRAGRPSGPVRFVLLIRLRVRRQS